MHPAEGWERAVASPANREAGEVEASLTHHRRAYKNVVNEAADHRASARIGHVGPGIRE